MLAEPVQVDGSGIVRVPNAPGLGSKLDEEAVAFHAVAREAVTVLDGSELRHSSTDGCPRCRWPRVRRRLAPRRQRDRVGRGVLERGRRPRGPRCPPRVRGRRLGARGPFIAQARPAPLCRADRRAPRGARRARLGRRLGIQSATPAASTSPRRVGASPGTPRRSTRSTARSPRPATTHSRWSAASRSA